MNILLFDTQERQKLFPLTLTRAVADLRMGILTVKERWEKVLKGKAYVLTQPYLQPLYEAIPEGEVVAIDSTVIVTTELASAILTLKPGEGLYTSENFIAGKVIFSSMTSFSIDFSSLIEIKREVEEVKRLEQ